MPITIPYDPSRMALYSPEHRETFFERGSSYTIPQLTVEAARLAYYRAEESAAEQARLAEALGRVGFTDLELFGNAERGAAAFAAIGSYGTPLLSFRGRAREPRPIEAHFDWAQFGSRDGDARCDDLAAGMVDHLWFPAGRRYRICGYCRDKEYRAIRRLLRCSNGRAA